MIWTVIIVFLNMGDLQPGFSATVTGTATFRDEAHCRAFVANVDPAEIEIVRDCALSKGL